MSKNQSASFAKWYDKNKQALAERRAKRYLNDAKYRQKIIDRSRLNRANNKPSQPNPEGYDHHMMGAAEALGITIWTLREWRKKDYFPEPVEFKGRLWFTGNQLQALRLLKQFFVKHGVRTSAANREALDTLVGQIYANWED
jgi:hypothetical protein